MSSADERQLHRPMFRAGKYGWIQPWNLSPVRLRTISCGPDAFLSVLFWASLFALCSCFGWLTPALAQTDVNDIHVTPRTAEKAKTEEMTKESIVSPSLNAHVRPLRASADLVLVPVTITDPMNRLGTGLEKENFKLSGATPGQGTKTFPIKVARVS